MSNGEVEAAKTDAPAAPPPSRPLPRWSLALVAGGHALVFAWAGNQLPWSEWSTFTIICYALALGHAATAVTAGLALQRPLTAIWRITSVVAVCVLGWLAWELTSSAAYLAGLYGELGEGVGAALLALIGLVAALTLPLAAWGLASTWRPGFTPGALVAVPLLGTIWLLGALGQARAARSQPLPVPVDDDTGLHADTLIKDGIDEVIPSWELLDEIPRERPRSSDAKGRRGDLRVRSLMTTTPVACVPNPNAPDEALAVVTYLRVLDERPTPDARWAPAEATSSCIRAPADQLAHEIGEHLLAEAAHGPLKIDVIRGVTPLHSRTQLLDMLALRPGLDGVCDENECLMPWQLVALDQFTVNEPLPWIPDFRLGVSAVELRAALGFEVPEDVLKWDRERRNPKRRARLEDQGKATPRPAEAASWLLLDGLSRIETLSYVVQDSGEFTPLVRLRERDLELDRAKLDHARELAEIHVARAQLRSGRFRYILHPFTGKQETKNWNLPRQAGTTLVVCELGQDPRRTRLVASRSLAYMAAHAREIGEVTALTKRKRDAEAHLGSTALPTIAFLACRPHVGAKNDALIAGLARYLVEMQRPDGSFYPALDTDSGQPIHGPEPMYAGGQAIFALSLAEKLALDQPDAAVAAGLASAEVLHEAVERAMAYYTGPYWDTFLRDFFWLEENWHCLAARASLDHHRNDAYERYCIDYMDYKARAVLDADSSVAPEFVGGYSFGNVLTPVSTPAAGFGEGLAAAMALAHARGEDTTADAAQMREVIEFLVRQQWTERNCFACAPQLTVHGGFSESLTAPEIRIDYTQHAWSALGHGGAWIYDDLPEGAFE